MPLFFHEVVLAKLRTEKDEVTEDECRKLLVGLMLKILDEASERCPQIPIYFETALLLIWRHKINDAEEWLRQTGIRLKTGDILQRYIAKALEALQKTHASI